MDNKAGELASGLFLFVGFFLFSTANFQLIQCDVMGNVHQLLESISLVLPNSLYGGCVLSH